MKLCLFCEAQYCSSLDICPICNSQINETDGFVSYAPSFSKEGGGFKANYFADLANLEAKNFWFKARNELIIWAMKKFCLPFQSFLEIGCGTGYVLSGIAEYFPYVKLKGSEIFTEGLHFASARLPNVDFMQMDARKIPYRNEFDVIGAYDVLEHIEEDEAVLGEIYAALKEKGFLLLTVPQHQWLWSGVDDYACHVRRYSLPDLNQKLKSAGFEVIRSSSFVSLLLPAMLISRLGKKTPTASQVVNEFEIPEWLNIVLYKLMRLEIGAIKLGLSFPVGGSRLIVARKKTFSVD
jgi:SAM-dependent methyltransferase